MKRLLAVGALLCCVLFAGAANAALVKFGNLVLTAEGGFTPQKLPRRSYAPIKFKGFANLKTVDGSTPPALRQIVLDFDRNGRLSTAGLPTCDPSLLQEATPAEARSRCPRAIVGTGHASAMISREGQPPILATSPITLFNGPRLAGKPTVILHARTTVPAVQDFAITIPIEKRGGLYAYKATIDLPPIAGGAGSLVHIDANVGLKYRYGGKERSYITARCTNGVLRTHGRFTFVDGTVVDGQVEKGCTAL